MADPRVEIPAMRREDFPLPTLGPRLRKLLSEVLQGRGFVLLRGLPVERWSAVERAAAYFGIGTHLGNAVRQNAKGHVLGHVRDLGRSGDDPTARIYQTTARQGYHTDSCDVVGLFCLARARSGGESSLISSMAAFNEMRKRRPDLLACLFDPVETDLRGEIGPTGKPYFSLPVFSWHAGLLSSVYHRKYIDSARRLPGVPAYTAAQEEAMDLLDSLLEGERLRLRMDFQPGDIQLVHNHTVLHDRTAFTDWPEPERKRHLLRLWLSPAEARPLPPVFADRYGSLTPGARGGVVLPRVAHIAPLEPE